MINRYAYKTIIGRLIIAEENNQIIEISFEEKDNIDYEDQKETPIIRKAIKQMQEYLYGTRKEFDLPLNPKGTLFQKAVWEVLKSIPYGETWSYQQVAEAIGNKAASRAVGMANHNNPIAIVIPCHRVIGKRGSMVGYAGGIDRKIELLNLEKQYHRK
ncbi:MAG TPA: methylated-DNA--[protein]-cysteine S-methyltransferase [Lachnospiraceae bacterium]|nr:methylated-DNA--[protein]-cysteine S-methyltransferase [Lachnospiraceae bacterium]